MDDIDRDADFVELVVTFIVITTMFVLVLKH